MQYLRADPRRNAPEFESRPQVVGTASGMQQTPVRKVQRHSLDWDRRVAIEIDIALGMTRHHVDVDTGQPPVQFPEPAAASAGPRRKHLRDGRRRRCDLQVARDAVSCPSPFASKPAGRCSRGSRDRLTDDLVTDCGGWFRSYGDEEIVFPGFAAARAGNGSMTKKPESIGNFADATLVLRLRELTGYLFLARKYDDSDCEMELADSCAGGQVFFDAVPRLIEFG